MTRPLNPSMFWRLWFRSISVKRPQAALAMGSILVGAALTSALLNLYGDVQRKMTQEFRAYGPNVVLAPALARPGATASSGPQDFADTIDQDVMRRLEPFRAQAREFAAVPIIYVATRVIRVPRDPRLEEARNAAVAGVDFAALRGLYPGWRVQGGGGAPTGKGCVVGSRLASRLRLGLGDAVEIEIVRRASSGVGAETAPEAGPGVLAARASGQRGALPQDEPEPNRYRITGLVSTGASEDDEVFLPLDSLQRAAGLEGKVSLVQLSVPGDTAEVERVVGGLSSALPDLEVRPVRQIVYSEGQVLGTIRWLLLLLNALVLVIMGLCVTATMTAIVLERRRDVAMMKALGASDRLVMRLFLTEGATLGLTGGVAGFALGGLLAQFLAHRLFDVRLSLVWWSLPAVCLSMVSLALVATAFPVRMVRTVQPAAVLKGE